MDRASNQIAELERKVDRLHQVVEHLSQQITVLVVERQQLGGSAANSLPTSARLSSSASPTSLSFNSAMEHKDILIDEGSWEDHSNQELSLDTQVRRLTAQLTAAYNRIAVLEEQLFDCRIHP